MPAIDPELIPGANLDPDGVDDAVRGLRANALAVRDAGVDVVGAWYGLRADYQAPEADQLLSALDPVRSDTATLGDDLEQVATALGRFAQDLRAIKSAFDVVRADAWTFHARIAANPEWEFDPELVAQNTTLLGRVNSVQVQLWDAERECANAIRAIDCLAPWNAGASDGAGAPDPNAFGLTTIPSETKMPWGAPVEQKEHCPASAVTSVRSAVWDGFAKDVIGEGFIGLGGLIGLGEGGFSADTFSATWGGMGALIGRDPDSGQWSGGTAGDAWLETGKSLVAWDMWEEDPARAFGTAAGNILLAVATLGTGAAIKGVATAGRTGQVLSATMQGARILGNAMDPIAVLRGGTALVATTRAGGVTAGLSAGLRSLSQIDLPDVPQLSNAPEPPAMKGNDIPVRMEASAVEKYSADGGHVSSVVERVHEPAMAGAVHGGHSSEGRFSTSGDTVPDGGSAEPHGRVPDADGPGEHAPDEGIDRDGGDRESSDQDTGGPDPDVHTDEPATDASGSGESGSGGDDADRSGIGDDPIAWENADEGVSLTESQKAAADEYLATSREIEPRITQDMQDLAAEHPGARLEGLDYRLKSEDSFYRKVATAISEEPLKPLDDLLSDMKDSVRYTFLVDRNEYSHSTQTIIDDLNNRGFEPYKGLKNTWHQAGYQGINSNWIDQSGRIIEVQFHTPDSFDAKMSTHPLYEEQRAPGTTPERAEELQRLQEEIFDNVPRPEGASEITWPDHTSEISSEGIPDSDAGAKIRDLATTVPNGSATALHAGSADPSVLKSVFQHEYGNLIEVNAPRFSQGVSGFDHNCTRCVVAADATLGGAPSSAMPSDGSPASDVSTALRGQWRSVRGYDSIVSRMNAIGDGARGVVLIDRGPGKVGHVFNVVNDKNGVVFLDAQSGTFAKLEKFHKLFFLKSGREWQ